MRARSQAPVGIEVRRKQQGGFGHRGKQTADGVVHDVAARVGAIVEDIVALVVES